MQMGVPKKNLDDAQYQAQFDSREAVIHSKWLIVLLSVPHVIAKGSHTS